MERDAFEVRLMKKHAGKVWESRSFVINSKGISWDGARKRKIVLAREMVRIGETDEAPNKLLKKCAFVVELKSGKSYTLCAASARQKLEVAAKLQALIDEVVAEVEQDKDKAMREKQALLEKERMLQQKREEERGRERAAQGEEHKISLV